MERSRVRAFKRRRRDFAGPHDLSGVEIDWILHLCKHIKRSWHQLFKSSGLTELADPPR